MHLKAGFFPRCILGSFEPEESARALLTSRASTTLLKIGDEYGNPC